MNCAVDLIPRESVRYYRVSQGDTSARRFVFLPKIGTADYALTDETVEYTQSNGARHACQIIDGAAVLDAYEDMTQDPGVYRSRLKITDQGGGILYSAAFIVEVEGKA